MDKTYAPQSIEKDCYQNWEAKNYFAPSEEGQSYCIMLPPPNVTGSLHMGHGFQHTIMDILSRYQRMNNKKVLWQPGTDHAGISTQMVVERQLEALGHTRKDFTREEFTQKIWDWKAESGGTITQQMRRIGDSVDWSRERFTMDKGLSDAVQKVFIQLYDEGLIYRGSRLVNWDPELATAVSDLEVTSEEEDGFLWHIQYPIHDSEEHLTIATTRPETMLGDVAVAVHPEDERYRHLIGKAAVLPLCDRHIPIIADEYVDPAFGTGCVKITPAHDFNDHAIGKRHDLPLISIMDKKAVINESAPAAYQGMERFEARKAILSDLETQNLLAKTEPHKLKVPRGEKSNAIIEPLVTEQWYVKIAPLAEPAIQAVRKGDVTFVPDNWSKTYFQWMENIEDWCISRQLWWGHRIPAWYDAQGSIYVGYSEKDVRFKYNLSADLILTQDEDVLDTWFSSALWPFSTLGWPESTDDIVQFYPTNVLVTGFDIIFFWVARMIMMGLKFTGKVPFHKVLITGLICDHEGKKMSKSKGNVLDPLDIIDGISLEDLLEKRTSKLMLTSAAKKIEKNTRKEYPDGIAAYGTDALRFTFCSIATTGREIRFDINRVEGYRNFCNKLWNAARYVLQNTAEEQTDFGDGAFQYSPADRWILSRLQKTIARSHEYIAEFRFDRLAQCLYEFVWHEYCDWYLELSKPVLYDAEALGSMKRGTRRSLIHVLDQILKLLHPIMPFITEAIWQRSSKLTSQSTDSIMLSAYPQVDESFLHEDIEEEMHWLQSVIQAVRTIRSEMAIRPSAQIPLLLKNANETSRNHIAKHTSLLCAMAKVSEITLLQEGEDAPMSATAVVGECELLIPMANLIDKDAELSRLKKELTKLEKEGSVLRGKLQNASFLEKAPAAVIEKDKARLKAVEETSQKLQKNYQDVEKL